MIRIDSYPTREYKGMKLREGKSLPFGATIVPGGVNFSVFSKFAISCELLLYHSGEHNPYAIIPFPDEFRIGNVFSMIVFDLDYETVEYGYRVDGKFNPKLGHRFDKSKVLLDPYARGVSGRSVWGAPFDPDKAFVHRSRIIYDDFDWQGDRPLELQMEDLIIYEMNIRSYTKHISSRVRHPGTFAGILDKISYLKELGINCVEFLPVFAFDEFESSNISKVTGERMFNCWGYSTVNFFAPKAGYAAMGKYSMEVDEFKNLIKCLHLNGIEIILDVVFNHTAEGNEFGPTISFRGLDNATYYLLTDDGHYHNFSGCGNTFNCNNVIVRNMILDCLRYWVSEFHIDGFRFDLASILSRDENGVPMDNPPLLETLAHDPILAKTKLIAEAWDAGGLYQVGSFPSWGRWAEWNGKYRDDIRRFIKGDGLTVGAVTDRILGSPSLYGSRDASVSINFITCHDGFTLIDLFSFNNKHNELNCEDNRDGTNDNNSWNCGYEGPTSQYEVQILRNKQMKNAITMLLMSRGIPMILAGDEFSNSQNGNNNAYCQDNDIYWLNWDNLRHHIDIFKYFRKMIEFRMAHPVLRNSIYNDYKNSTGYPEVSIHQKKAWEYDNTSTSLVMAVMFAESGKKYNLKQDSYIYFAMNMHWLSHNFELPKLPEGYYWNYVASTDVPGSCFFEKEIQIEDQNKIHLKGRSTMIIIGKLGDFQ